MRSLIVAACLIVVGCGESNDAKQPKLTGPPDPKITGPASFGGAAKGGNGKLP